MMRPQGMLGKWLGWTERSCLIWPLVAGIHNNSLKRQISQLQVKSLPLPPSPTCSGPDGWWWELSTAVSSGSPSPAQPTLWYSPQRHCSSDHLTSTLLLYLLSSYPPNYLESICLTGKQKSCSNFPKIMILWYPISFGIFTGLEGDGHWLDCKSVLEQRVFLLDYPGFCTLEAFR